MLLAFVVRCSRYRRGRTWLVVPAMVVFVLLGWVIPLSQAATIADRHNFFMENLPRKSYSNLRTVSVCVDYIRMIDGMGVLFWNQS